MSDPSQFAADAAARGKLASDYLTECRAALFLPMRLLILAFGKDHAEACISGVFHSALADVEQRRRTVLGFTEEVKP